MACEFVVLLSSAASWTPSWTSPLISCGRWTCLLVTRPPLVLIAPRRLVNSMPKIAARLDNHDPAAGCISSSVDKEYLPRSAWEGKGMKQSERGDWIRGVLMFLNDKVWTCISELWVWRRLSCCESVTVFVLVHGNTMIVISTRRSQ